MSIGLPFDREIRVLFNWPPAFENDCSRRDEGREKNGWAIVRGHEGGKRRRIIPSDGFIYGSPSTAAPHACRLPIRSCPSGKSPAIHSLAREKNKDRDRGIK